MNVFNSFTIEPAQSPPPGRAAFRATLDIGPLPNSKGTRVRIETDLENGQLPVAQLLEHICGNAIELLQRMKAAPPA